MRLRKAGGRFVLWVFLTAVLIFTLFPIVMALLGSFKTNAELNTGATFLPLHWNFSNYIKAWKEANFAVFTWNSLYMSFFSTVGTVVIASMAAYAVDRREFACKRLFLGLQAGTMFVAMGAIMLRPQFDVMVALHLNRSIWAVIILNISAHAFAFFILLGFMKGIPRDMDEAAKLDGAGFGYIYARIIMPLLLPGLGVTSLFAFRNAWNEYIMPLVFTMTQPKLQVLTVGLANLKYSPDGAQQSNLMLAGACLSMIPILIVYLLANKSFTQVNTGGIKG
ncbi:carbohydrate ABC transporter permease [Paenibacillus thalictri]|uniref:Carbohydrate ABC transporter permease n=1 Tax=Paenibacillus thalictri TaxID=2527873 RepID=A0A4Q9DSD7_9BACL|nr:carbohydrate ABC transporter permease [Paenibacillus thalictri]